MRIISEIGEAAEPKFRIVGTQTVVTKDNLLDKCNITGTIDGFVQVEVEVGMTDGTTSKRGKMWATEAVIDIKTSSPHVFAMLSDYDSLSRFPWTRKYRGQIMLYALAHNIEHCILWFVNKTNLFDHKIIEFPLDYGYAERLLQKAELVNLHVEANTFPEKLNQPDECSRCDFAHICMPDIIGQSENWDMSENQELQELLDERQLIAVAGRRFAGIERRLKDMLVKGRTKLCGGWLIEWTSHEKSGYTVPPGVVHKKKITNLKVQTAENEEVA